MSHTCLGNLFPNNLYMQEQYVGIAEHPHMRFAYDVGYNYTFLHVKTTSSSSYGSRKEIFPHYKPISDIDSPVAWSIWTPGTWVAWVQ